MRRVSSDYGIGIVVTIAIVVAALFLATGRVTEAIYIAVIAKTLLNSSSPQQKK